uniref:Uncharacterized protein n=1 Tax=Globodera pallida TaxID=36090 RepID=A0A183C7W1_GLOPA
MSARVRPFYGVMKAALDHWTRVMALNCGEKGVRVNSIKLGCPVEPPSDQRARPGASSLSLCVATEKQISRARTAARAQQAPACHTKHAQAKQCGDSVRTPSEPRRETAPANESHASCSTPLLYIIEAKCYNLFSMRSKEGE